MVLCVCCACAWIFPAHGSFLCAACFFVKLFVVVGTACCDVIAWFYVFAVPVHGSFYRAWIFPACSLFPCKASVATSLPINFTAVVVQCSASSFAAPMRHQRQNQIKGHECSDRIFVIVSCHCQSIPVCVFNDKALPYRCMFQSLGCPML